MFMGKTVAKALTLDYHVIMFIKLLRKCRRKFFSSSNPTYLFRKKPWKIELPIICYWTLNLVFAIPLKNMPTSGISRLKILNLPWKKLDFPKLYTTNLNKQTQTKIETLNVTKWPGF
jgi:hypothetical protein